MLQTTTARSFDALNSAQRGAAMFGTVLPGAGAGAGTPAGAGVEAGPLLILAGAGTGKTNALAHRTAFLVLNGVDPARILMLTFTRRAAQEMIRRTDLIVGQALAEDTRRGGRGDPTGRGEPRARSGRSVASRLTWSGTFHAVGSRILRAFATQIGLDPHFSVLDRTDAADLMDVVRHEQGLSAKDRRFPRKDACLSIYTQRVNTRLSLRQTLVDAYPWASEWEEELTRLYREYVVRKQKHNVLDFDDLLLYWHAMMQTPALAHSLGRNFDHVLVDEYQDTNALQGDIIQALKPDGHGVTVVGDDAQSIYSFRAASVDNILGFADRYQPPAQRVVLTQNYRSTQQILDCANALMDDAARQHRKTLVGLRQSPSRPYYVVLDDALAQAEYIATRILAARETGGALRGHAVLFRSSHHSDVLEVELTRRNIPFVKYGGLKFLDAAHVKDMLCVLRWADNPRNAVAGFRVLKLIAGIGPAHAKQVLEHLEAHAYDVACLAGYPAPAAATADWRQFCGVFGTLAAPATPWPGQVGRVRGWYTPQLERIYDAAFSRTGDLEQLETLATQYPSRERFLTELTLDPPSVTSDLSDGASKDEDYVILSTIHSAKGQEWDHVYVLNVADGNFPSEFSTGKPLLVEEERRLLYVAMTRARNELHLCAPLRYSVTQQARTGDRHVYAAKSRFLTERVLGCFEQTTYVQERAADRLRMGGVTDVAAQLRDLW